MSVLCHQWDHYKPVCQNGALGHNVLKTWPPTLGITHSKVPTTSPAWHQNGLRSL